MVNIHIKTADGGVRYPNALQYGVEDQILGVRVIADPQTREADTIFFSPGYWQQYVVDPRGDNPLGLRDL